MILFTLITVGCGSVNEGKPDDDLKFQNKGHELVYAMVEKVGSYDALSANENVEYTCTYIATDGKTNVSTEKYIFDGELSYGKYSRHERLFPELEGEIEQAFDGNNFWLKHNGELITDEKRLKKVTFVRHTNFYWFAMMQKLLDPGIEYEYLGEEMINNKSYELVKISFIRTDDEPADVYQLYINKETSLVDQFLFTVVDYDMMDPFLMQVEYEEVGGILIPVKRKYKESNWAGVVSDEPWIVIEWSEINFNTNITKDYFTP